MAERFYDSVPFLIHRAAAAGVERADRDFDKIGHNIAEARVLIAVLQTPGIRAGQLSDQTSIAQSTLSHILRRLTRRGLLIRSRDEDDNRSVMVELTPSGRRSAKECHRLTLMQEQMTVTGMDQKRIDALRELLHQIYENLGPPKAVVSVAPEPARRKRLA
jgi:MarR family transcriptional regulator, organic hydroperoxide resistance regulator